MDNKQNNNEAKTADYYSKRGLEKYEKKDYDGAIADCDEAIKLNPEFITAYVIRGLAKHEKADSDGAIADFTKAIELKPDYAEGYHYRGTAKYVNGDNDGAIADFTEAIKFNPEYLEALNERGIAKLKKFEQLEKIDKESASKYLDEAIADFDKVIELYNNNDYENNLLTKNYIKDLGLGLASTYYHLGLAHNKYYKENKALECYKKAFELTNYTIPTNKIFYQFRPYNQYTLSSLILNNLFLNDPKNFNDPFDSILLRKDKTKIPPSLFQFNQNIQITCVSEELKNILMWSYYAQNHQGIAIGYKFSEEKFKTQKAFFKNVDYKKEILNHKWENLFEEAYLGKFENWQHEKEWRLVYHKDDTEQDPVLLDLEECGINIAQIVFGLYCPKDQREAIIKIFENKPTKPEFFETKIQKDNSFAIEKVPYHHNQ